jgi:ABC-2 type transport system ATP-binding protein
VQVPADPPGGISSLWGEMWHRGWHILEIRSEASGLEELYIHNTGRDRIPAQETAT